MTTPFAWGAPDGSAWAALPEAITHDLQPGPMDWALARTLNAHQAATDARQLALVAATSAAWRQGHACLLIEHAQLSRLCEAMPWCHSGEDRSPLVWQAPRLYLRRAWQAEATIRQALMQRLQVRDLPPPARLAELETACGFSDQRPSEAAQRDAARAALRQSFTLITGGPGTGKTHVVARILAMRQAQALRLHGKALNIGLAAPTGKAAARLGESLAKAARQLPADWVQHLPSKATTLHRALMGASPQQPLMQDLWVVDEASMIDLELMARWLSCLPPQADVVLLGDSDQLASVEAGAVLAQLCESPSWSGHRVHLSHSHRFDPNAGVGQWARLTQTGDATALQQAWAALPEVQPQMAWDGLSVGRCSSTQAQPEALAAWMRHGWQRWRTWFEPLRTGQTPCDDAMALEGLHALGELGVLCATHQGPQGVHALNTWISQLLDLPQADASGWFAGRPVMVQSNLPQLGLLNGDVGLCVPRRVGDRVQLRVAFAQPQNPQSPVKWLAPSLVHPVQTAWAMTVHKSQGSEFERLLIVVPERDMPLMTREWVYTALTRAKQSVVLWSSQPAVWQAAVQRPTRRQGGLGLSFGDPIRSGVS